MPRRLFSDRQKERATQRRIQSRIANEFAGSVRAELERAGQEATRAYLQDEATISVDIALSDHADKLRETILPRIARATQLGGGRILEGVKAFHGRFERKQADQNRVEGFQADVQAFLTAEGAARVVAMAETTKLLLQREIKLGLEAGESVDQIGKRMRRRVALMSTHRAMRIARTETHAAYNAGHDMGASRSGLDLSKEWISAFDDRTRDEDDAFNHEDADGEIVKSGQLFTLTGEPLRYPGDSSGSAANVIHCRCGRGDIVN